MAVLSCQSFLSQSFSLQLVLLFSPSSSCRCCTGHVFQGCNLSVMPEPGFVSRLVCAKAEQRYCSIMTDQCSLRKRQRKDAGSWVYLYGHKKTFSFFATAIRTGLI